MSKRLILSVAAACLAVLPALASDFRVPAADASPPVLGMGPRPLDVESIDMAKLVDQDAMAAFALKDEDFYVDALAATFSGDPMKAYDWVTKKVRFEPYAGVLRGAQRTLVARAGNAADRALLMAALLNELGVKTRFATASLDDAAADTLVQSAFGTTSVSMSAPRGDMTDAVAARAGRDYALLRTALATEAAAATDTSLAQAREAVRNHIWVEAEIGGVWTALDPSAGEAGKTLAAASGTMDALPDSAFQTVTLKIAATSIADGAVTTAEPLNVTLKASDASAAAIFLGFVQDPEKSGGIGGAINDVLGGEKRYVPVLWVEGEPFVGEAIAGLTPSAEASAAQDFLGGDDTGEPKPELARLVLTIETAAPGEAPVTATRTLVDRAPGVAAIDAATVLRPMPMAQGLPSAAALMHNVWISTGPLDLKNAYALRALALTEIVMTYSDPEKVEGLSPADMLWPAAAFNAALPMALENSAIPGMNDRAGVKVFTGRPRVSLFSSGSVDGPDAADFRVSEIDLKLGGATVLAREGEATAAFEARLWVGVVEAAMETEFGMRANTLVFDPATTVQASASVASNGTLVRLGAGGSELPDNAPGDAVAAATAGRVLFAPAGVLVAWWDVDPANGTTRAMLNPDLGGFRSYGGYRPDPTNRLNSSWGNQRTGMQSGGGGNVTHISADGRRSIDYGPNGRIARAGGGGGPPPNRCGGGSEYMIIVGCVSLPAGWALRQAYAVVITEIVIAAAGVILQL